jgi:hypothetical protein
MWLLLVSFCLLAGPALAAEKPQEWEIINPTGVVKKPDVKPAKRLTSLAGKTVVLRWNGKHNGDNFLQRISELLAEKEPTAKIIKAWQTDPSLNKIAGNAGESKRIANALKEMGADIVIAAQCD